MFLSQLFRLFRAWRRYEKSLRELNRLEDRDFADIRASRCDIPRLAREHARYY
jgi:uncharacterized protein YjiS (DUF1127 family)